MIFGILYLNEYKADLSVKIKLIEKIHSQIYKNNLTTYKQMFKTVAILDCIQNCHQ